MSKRKLKKTAQSQIDPNDIFNSLFDGFIDLTSFLTEYFTRKPVYCASTTNDRLVKLREELGEFDVETLLSSTASDSINVWIDGNDQKIDAIAIDSATAAFKLFESGFRTYCRCPKEFEECIVPQLLKTLGMGFAGCDNQRNHRGEIELFCTRTSHVTDWHFDFQENFTIQLQGHKQWRFKPSNIQCPVRNCSPHYTSPETAEMQLAVRDHFTSCDSIMNFMQIARLQDPEFMFTPPIGQEIVIDMRPGDVLYFPSGIWHRVEAMQDDDDECDNVSINISLTSGNIADIVASSVRQTLVSSMAGRKYLSSLDRQSMIHATQLAIVEARKFLDDLDARMLIPPLVVSDGSETNFVCDNESVNVAALEIDEEQANLLNGCQFMYNQLTSMVSVSDLIIAGVSPVLDVNQFHALSVIHNFCSDDEFNSAVKPFVFYVELDSPIDSVLQRITDKKQAASKSFQPEDVSGKCDKVLIAKLLLTLEYCGYIYRDDVCSGDEIVSGSKKRKRGPVSVK